MEDPTFIRLWRRAWKSRLPLKIWVFVWLLLRRRLMTRAYRQRMAPESTTECALCAGAMEDCEHLFVTCPFASSVWLSTRVAPIDLSSWEAFWRSISDGPYRLKAEWQCIFAFLWSMEPPQPPLSTPSSTTRGRSLHYGFEAVSAP